LGSYQFPAADARLLEKLQKLENMFAECTPPD
jgi:hypothetical protein